MPDLPPTDTALIDLKDIVLRVPIIRPEDRQILSNPKRLLADLYFARTKRDVVTLLDGISFTLQAGERLGLIGANGAGKSTLLRVLAGIYQPTEGKLVVNGTAKGMFDISLGMNNEATGLENIYMRGLQMGLSLKEVRSRVPHIVEFSELEDAIENPLNTYSTGMRMRLAFSVSTMVDTDILLLDEWIGAGDARFREKVKERMDGLVAQSRGLVLATHNAGLMKSLCTHGLVLEGGRMAFIGELGDALNFYQTEIATKSRQPQL